MPRRPVGRKDRAVSPVIATIILVAVAIVMAIAVAYWALGLGGTFTRYEKIEIMSMYATKSTGQWTITAKLRNTGGAAATINMVLINGRPYSDYKFNNNNVVTVEVDSSQFDENTGVTLNPGDSQTFTIKISTSGNLFVPGMSVEVTFHTASGSDYPKVVILP